MVQNSDHREGGHNNLWPFAVGFMRVNMYGQRLELLPGGSIDDIFTCHDVFGKEITTRLRESATSCHLSRYEALHNKINILDNLMCGIKSPSQVGV